MSRPGLNIEARLARLERLIPQRVFIYHGTHEPKLGQEEIVFWDNPQQQRGRILMRVGNVVKTIGDTQAMEVSVYDADGDGVVDAAEALGSWPAADYLRRNVDETVSGGAGKQWIFDQCSVFLSGAGLYADGEIGSSTGFRLADGHTGLQWEQVWDPGTGELSGSHVAVMTQGALTFTPAGDAIGVSYPYVLNGAVLVDGLLAVGGNVYFTGGNWNTGHVQLGSAHIWFDGTNIRAKTSAPTSATDGTILV